MYFENVWKLIADNSGIIIALCALVLTIWQAFLTRTHNKLTVKPYLTTWSTMAGNEDFYQVDLMNNGVGPALIQSFRVYVDNQELLGTESDLIDTAIKMLFSQSGYDSHNAFLSKGYMMAANDRHELIKIKFSNPNVPRVEEVENAYKRIRIVIEYVSIYNDKYAFDSSNYSLLN
jgi:hypothetical protein